MHAAIRYHMPRNLHCRLYAGAHYSRYSESAYITRRVNARAKKKAIYAVGVVLQGATSALLSSVLISGLTWSAE